MRDASDATAANAVREGTVSPGLVVLLAVSAWLTAFGSDRVALMQLDSYVHTTLLQGAVYLLAAFLVLRRGARSGDLWVILIGAVLLRGLAMTAPPNVSNDAWRYVWDGRLQWHGYNPYLYIPVDPILAHLRDAIVYPMIHFKETSYTIYPPMAEVMFALGAGLIDSIEGQKLVMAACEALTIWGLLRILSMFGLPRARVVLYAWHPLPIWELSGHAHCDAGAMAFAVVATMLAWERRQALAGAALGLAILVKYFPVVLFPALWRRWDWRMPVAMVAVVVLGYLPYWWTGGPRVLGFLLGHLDREGYRAGYGFHVVWVLRDFSLADPPVWLYFAIVMPVLAALATWAFLGRQRDEIRVVHVQALALAFALATSAHYPWYIAWLVPLIVLRASPALLSITLMAPLLHLQGDAWWQQASTHYMLVYGVAFVLVLGAAAKARVGGQAAQDAIRPCAERRLVSFDEQFTSRDLQRSPGPK